MAALSGSREAPALASSQAPWRWSPARRALAAAAALAALLSIYYLIFIHLGHTVDSLSGRGVPPRGSDILFPVLARGGPLEDEPPIEGLAWPRRLCAGGAPQPRVAVCLVGSVRTFINPLVYESQIDNILRALGTEHIDVFVDLQVHSAAEFNASWGPLRAAIGRLRPRHYEVELVDRYLGTQLFNHKCRLPPGSDLRHWGWPWGHGYIVDSFTGQYRNLQRCVGHLKRHEAAQGFQYDFVVKTRTDIVLFQSLPPICTYSPRHVYSSGDLLMVIPRRAEAVLEMLDTYRNCSGFHAAMSPEAFLSEAGRAAGYSVVTLLSEIMIMRVAVPGKPGKAHEGACAVSGLFAPFRGAADARCVQLVGLNPSNIV